MMVNQVSVRVRESLCHQIIHQAISRRGGATSKPERINEEPESNSGALSIIAEKFGSEFHAIELFSRTRVFHSSADQ